METFIYAIIAVLLLVPIMYIIPIGFNMKGKLLIIGASCLLALTGILANFTLPLWQTGLVLVGLALVMTFLLDRQLRKLQVASGKSQQNKDTQVKPQSDQHQAALPEAAASLLAEKVEPENFSVDENQHDALNISREKNESEEDNHHSVSPGNEKEVEKEDKEKNEMSDLSGEEQDHQEDIPEIESLTPLDASDQDEEIPDMNDALIENREEYEIEVVEKPVSDSEEATNDVEDELLKGRTQDIPPEGIEGADDVIEDKAEIINEQLSPEEELLSSRSDLFNELEEEDEDDYPNSPLNELESERNLENEMIKEVIDGSLDNEGQEDQEISDHLEEDLELFATEEPELDSEEDFVIEEINDTNTESDSKLGQPDDKDVIEVDNDDRKNSEVIPEEDPIEENQALSDDIGEDVVQENEEEEVTLTDQHVKPRNLKPKTKLQSQMFHSMVEQIRIQGKRMTQDEYEVYVKEHLHPDLPDQDYYTFAQLLIQHYIKTKNKEKLQELLPKLMSKYEYHTILYQELTYIFQQYCQDIS